LLLLLRANRKRKAFIFRLGTGEVPSLNYTCNPRNSDTLLRVLERLRCGKPGIAVTIADDTLLAVYPLGKHLRSNSLNVPLRAHITARRNLKRIKNMVERQTESGSNGSDFHSRASQTMLGGAIMTRNREAGQSLILVALAMVMLIGVMGFAVDFGYYRFLRRQLQTAADAAALAGAMDITYGDYSNAAKAASAENGFTNGTGGVTVTVSNPPSSGVFTGAAYKNYVQATVSIAQANIPTFFSQIVGAKAPNGLSATAVAEGGLNCIYGLDQGNGALSLFLSVVSSTCGVVDNDNLSLTVAALCAPSIQLVGSQTGFFGLSCSGGFQRAKTVKIASPVADPFCQTGASCLPAPSPALLPTCSGANGTYTVTGQAIGPALTPALTTGAGYCTGITITSSGTAAHPVTFAAGNYKGPIKIVNSYVTFLGGSMASTYAINSASQPGINIASNNLFGGSTVNFQAATYTIAGGLSDAGSFGSYINFNSTSGQASLMILDGGGMKLVGNSGASGSAGQSTGGITFYNTGTAAGACVTCYGQITSYFNFSGTFCGAACNMTAPTTGTYAGILFFQDRNDTSTASCFFGAAASACFGASVGISGPVAHTGAYYFPSGTVDFDFNFGSGAPYTYLIAKDANWYVNFQFNSNYASLPTSFPLRQGAAVLVQ
jgi:Flp pilus assembly protein TadG